MDKPFLNKLRKIDPYVPGEQPKTDNIIKLNANENPYPPAPGVTEVLRTFDAAKLAIYPDANAKALKTAIAERFDLQPSQVFLGNGSDDVLALAFQSFFCSDRPNGGIVLPNPNAPTGRGVTLEFLEDLLQHNQDCVVIIDEAYVDFGAQSAVPLLGKYENLLIVQTTSKSRSLAGMRIGYALGSETLISTLEAVKNSYNSYTMDAIALAVGEASIRDEDYFQQTCRKVSTTRDRSAEALRALGFTQIPSCGACLSNMAIAPDGTVLPCQSWLTGKGLGNLLRTPWPRIWHSHECRAIREESAKMAQRCQLGDTPMQEGCR